MSAETWKYNKPLEQMSPKEILQHVLQHQRMQAHSDGELRRLFGPARQTAREQEKEV